MHACSLALTPRVAAPDEDIAGRSMQVLTYTDYALRVLLYVGAYPDTPVPASAIARAYGISIDHVAKAAKSLTRHGTLKATRGAGGGLELAQPASEIRVGDIVSLFERGRGPVECFRDDARSCKILAGCRLRDAFERASEAFYDELNRHSLAELIGSRTALVRLLAPPKDMAERRARLAG
jgi:Rrf2 family transcriptional regulator, nitric oxide-sensitive transcriptional repressor